MKKYFLLFILIAFVYNAIKAQEYAEEHYHFNTYYNTMLGFYNYGEDNNAANFADTIKTNYKKLNKRTLFLIARVYANNVDYINTIEFLEKAVKKGTTKTSIERSYDLDLFRENNLYLILESNYDKWHQEYLDAEKSIQLDSNYIKKINTFNKIYDDARYHLHARKKGDSTYFPSDSTTRHTARIIVDSLFYKMLDLVIENGFPTTARVGRKIGESYYPFSKRFLYEVPDSFSLENPKWIIVKKMITEEMSNGNLKPFFYASFMDNYRLSKNEPQLYGTINYVYNYNAINYLEYENPEELNIRRRAVGLCSIQLKLWSAAQDLPPALQNITFK